MPLLDFKGKSFVYTHHLSVPYRELLVEPTKSCVPKGERPDLDDNLIIHGDNLEALKALMPRYAGKVDCIFIDPPYNTGNEGWCYNDAVNAPLMREWLKHSASPVDRDDLERHDKWLCMMWPRLQLLKDLLAEDGAIFVSIDDNEVHRLRAMMDEIFGEEGFVAEFVWKSRVSEDTRAKSGISTDHEYVLCYSRFPTFRFDGVEKEEGKFTNPDGDARGPWRSADLTGLATKEQRPNLHYGLVNEATGISYCCPPKGWRYDPTTMALKKGEKRILWPSTPDGRPRLKLFEKELRQTKNLSSVITWPTTLEGTRGLNRALASNGFSFPKPSELVELFIAQTTGEDSIILDSFAGSGTTAHAVLALNAKDGGNRKFILCEMEDYADTLTAERVRRVIEGYTYTGTQETELQPPENITWTTFSRNKARAEILERIEGIKTLQGADYDKIEAKIENGMLSVVGKKQVRERMPGLGGRFAYVELGEAMDLERLLAETPGTLPGAAALARYLFFTATGHTLKTTEAPSPKKTAGKKKAKTAEAAEPASEPVLIGETAVWRIYLHYRPDEEWLRSPAAAFTRTHAEGIAAECTAAGKQALVFAAAKYVNHRTLRELSVDFAQLPYALHRIQAE
ncbi:MAG TPA: site-specific DNA-methyltransferase [Verrucomicrobia bacterium]|nr:site-specific DNA-methyltransferase [Verrucomicrobiota bacterium]